MKELQKILVCVDLSDYSKQTMEYGVALARGLMTEITVLNVINIRDIEAIKAVTIHYPKKINVEDYIERTREDRYRQIQELIHEHFQADKGKMRSVIDIGVPFKTILKTVEDENIDLVVIGNKGKGNVVGTLFGTNAEKVFRHSPVPVLSVRANEHFGR